MSNINEKILQAMENLKEMQCKKTKNIFFFEFSIFLE